MGEGLTQVGLLAVLLLVVLPGCFFTLLALLDRMEHSLAPESMRPAATVAHAVAATDAATADVATSGVATAAVDTSDADTSDADVPGGDVIALPRTATISPEPAVATG